MQIRFGDMWFRINGSEYFHTLDAFTQNTYWILIKLLLQNKPYPRTASLNVPVEMSAISMFSLFSNSKECHSTRLTLRGKQVELWYEVRTVVVVRNTNRKEENNTKSLIFSYSVVLLLDSEHCERETDLKQHLYQCHIPIISMKLSTKPQFKAYLCIFTQI